MLLHASPYSNVVEHLICIGDPKQLRPNVSTFGESPTFSCYAKLDPIDSPIHG